MTPPNGYTCLTKILIGYDIVAFIFFFFAFWAATVANESTGNFIPLGIIFLVLPLCITIKFCKHCKETNDKSLLAPYERKVNCIHFTGLPVPENAECVLCFDADKLSIESLGTTFNLPYNKIVQMAVKTNEEIQKQYVSNAGGAVGGALLFGPIGAMIGGRIRTLETKNRYYYLMIAYKTENDMKYIAFDVSKEAILISEYVKLIKNNVSSTEGKSVEL